MVESRIQREGQNLKLLNMKETEKDYRDIDSLINSTEPAIFWKDKPVIKKQKYFMKF